MGYEVYAYATKTMLGIGKESGYILKILAPILHKTGLRSSELGSGVEALTCLLKFRETLNPKAHV